MSARPDLACLLAGIALSLATGPGWAKQQGHDHSQHGGPQEHSGHDGHTSHDQHQEHDGDQHTEHADHAQHTQHAHHEHNGAHFESEQLPREPIPPVTDADRAAAFPQLHHHMEHPAELNFRVLFDRFEWQDADAGSAFAWENKTWIGSDLNRLWIRSGGERVSGATHSAHVDLLYGRSVSAWWDVVGGVRHDFSPGPSRTWAALGVQGLAPYWFEISATAYVGERGHVAAELEVEYELLVTNRLILQPVLELELHGKDDPARGIGSGLSSAELGLRLRYEVSRRFAPYIGVTSERLYGDTARYHRQAGGDARETRLVAGVRWWF